MREFPLYSDAAVALCPTARFVGGVSRWLCECKSPRDCKGVLYTKKAKGFIGGRWVWVIPTGEVRPPRKGEYYLSGAMPAAYQAGYDFNTPYMIGRPEGEGA
jgi:hypothetical protein